ncbi:MAG: hypothetical protein GY915_06885 [bacterium]|nr:hypothetical protein [bacterium]
MTNFSNQLPLPLTPEETYLWETFILSVSNEETVAHLKSWKMWDSPCTLLLGPKGSGKTHLSCVWRKETGALKFSSLDSLEASLEALENNGSPNLLIDPLPASLTPQQQEILFHIYNAIKGKQGKLLITLDRPLAQQNISLKDLLSRLKASHKVDLKDPDDSLLRGLLVKNCSQHQLRIPAATLDYLSVRLKRQYAEIHKTTKILIQESLARKNSLTIPFVKGILSI